MVNWDEYFMSMVYFVAVKSKDKSTHIGAVVIGPDNEIKTTGYNSFVRKLRDDVPERQVRPEKYFWFEHAERNAIYNATLNGISLKNCRMYTNGVPCMDCARGIVQSGISEVIIDEDWEKNNPPEWLKHSEKSILMFKEVGVKLRYWKGDLLVPEKYMRGEFLK